MNAMAGRKAETETVSARCCVVGGGPAGAMVSLLLARAGVQTVLLEKHLDFLRDFRGDTVHPTTQQVLDDLGLIEQFAALPNSRESTVLLEVGGEQFPLADFRGCKPFNSVCFVPQWDLLDLLTREANKYPNFQLMMGTEARALIRGQKGRVVGVQAVSGQSTVEVRADLVICCDGRGSILRTDSGLPVHDYGAPMDILWFRLPRTAQDTDRTIGFVSQGRLLVMINRREYWQCAYMLLKGDVDKLRSDPHGLEKVRSSIVRAAPFLISRVGALQTMDQLKPLNVQVNRLEKWYQPGALFIGDAAHAMSPVGGVGINVAIQDAVAAYNELVEPLLREGPIADEHLRRVERRRMLPAKTTQALQQLVHDRAIAAVLEGSGTPRLPLLARLALRSFIGPRIIGTIIGRGIQPERPRLKGLPRSAGLRSAPGQAVSA
jgi:2-polyprenyl-6-methoxyphenol hydroxylase-like FAD-dependent oxidoreductase